MKFILKLSIFSLLLCASVFVVSAQIPTTIDGITITTDPENPAPGQNVSISIESYNTDLSSASIIWSVGGKTYNQGIGMKSISIKAPKLGATLNVNIYIKTSEGREVQKSVSIRSGSVDIIWETKGYIPNFFKGKTPFAYQNTLHLIAVPHLSVDGIKEINPATLIYKWKLGGKYIDGASGYGIQSVDIKTGEIPKQIDISVEVYTKDQQRNTFGEISLNPTSPSVYFYEEDLLYGIFFNRALSNRVQLKNSEMKVLAVPFGFNMDSKNDTNSYSWSINNVEQEDLVKNQSIIIRTKGDQSGSSNIDLDIRNLNNILQGARNSFSVYFNKKATADTNVTF